LFINLRHAALSTHYRFSKLYIRAVRTRILHLLQNIFPPYNQLQQCKKPREKQLLTSKSKNDNLWIVWRLSHPTFSFHTEKEDKAKIPQHLPKTLAQATKQSRCWNRSFWRHLVWRFRRRALSKSLSTRVKISRIHKSPLCWTLVYRCNRTWLNNQNVRRISIIYKS